MTRNHTWQTVQDCEMAIRQLQDYFAPLADENYIDNADADLILKDLNHLRTWASILQSVADREIQILRQIAPPHHLMAAE